MNQSSGTPKVSRVWRPDGFECRLRLADPEDGFLEFRTVGLRSGANIGSEATGRPGRPDHRELAGHRTARRRHPGFEQLDTAGQWQALERLTRQPPSIISQALGPLPAKRLSSADFSRQVACLQTLRNAL